MPMDGSCLLAGFPDLRSQGNRSRVSLLGRVSSPVSPLWDRNTYNPFYLSRLSSYACGFGFTFLPSPYCGPFPAADGSPGSYVRLGRIDMRALGKTSLRLTPSPSRNQTKALVNARRRVFFFLQFRGE